MPPSGFSKKAVKGALIFIQECYKDLLEEVKAGKHRSVEDAIEFEISQIEKALDFLHIDAKGRLVRKADIDIN